MEREALKQKLHGTTVMVSVDCWSTQDSAACLGLCINNHLWFLADTETANHTGPWLASEVSREIVKIEKELNCEVAGSVSDNASNMESMRAQLKESHPGTNEQFRLLGVFFSLHAGIESWGCQAHVLNLLVGDILKDKGRELVIAKVTTVLKGFKKSTLLSGHLRQAGIGRPVLPVATRWGTNYDSLLYYNRNWAFLAQFAATNLAPNDPIRLTTQDAQISAGVHC